MNNKPLEREPIDRVRARLEALLKANAAPRCGVRSKRTGKPCRGAAMPNWRCKLHGGKSTGPRTPEGLERSRRANWKHGHYSREAKAERSRLREATTYAPRSVRLDLKAPAIPRSDTDHTGPPISPDRPGIDPSVKVAVRRIGGRGHATLATKRTLLLDLGRTSTGWIAPALPGALIRSPRRWSGRWAAGFWRAPPVPVRPREVGTVASDAQGFH